MIRLDDVQIFVQTVDAGSFSEAARQLSIAPGLASSAVQRLEKALAVRLFVRSTRSMQLSEDGERYLPHARALLAALAQGEQALAPGAWGAVRPAAALGSVRLRPQPAAALAGRVPACASGAVAAAAHQ